MNQEQQAHRAAESIFRSIFPRQGMTVREQQIQLCHHMIDALFQGKAALCDAGVGIGKTYAYLAALVVWRKYAVSPGQSVVISTSSVALQTAIIQEYLPFLSAALLAGGIISQPLCAVVRKGKERFVCDRRLKERTGQINRKTRDNRQQRAVMAALHQQIDLDAVKGLTALDRSLVCVPAVCPRNCPNRDTCRYQNYLQAAMGPAVTIQICNHNYLLADAVRREQGERPLLRDYGVLVIDEAHKLPEAARQTFDQQLSPEDWEGLCTAVSQEKLSKDARRLRERMQAFWDTLQPNTNCSVAWRPASRQKQPLKALHSALSDTMRHLEDKPRWLLRRLQEADRLLTEFQAGAPNQVLYLQYDRSGSATLCAATRDGSGALRRILWTRPVPAILTSGTLAAGGDFTHMMKTLGLTLRKPTTFQAASPFDYQNNTILYLPARPRQPLAAQIEALVTASHGHALVLFTSYREMGEVCAALRDRLPYPLIEVWRNGQQLVHTFKQLPNAVLCAAGPCWEGLDFPGDMVSMLMMTRLPFPVPDPVSDAARERYMNLPGYLQAEIVPQMQIKLRQGFGRAIRTEQDTCAVALLDPRASPGGRYHQAAVDALPACPVTTEIETIQQFFRERKSPDYFLHEEVVI